MIYTYLYGGIAPYVQLNQEEVNFLIANNMQPLWAEGVPLLSMEHNPYEVQKLVVDGNFAFDRTDDPVERYIQDLPGQFDTPLPWHPDMMRLAVNNWRWYMPAFMSSGKTAFSYWSIDLLMNLGLVNRALIVTTVSGMTDAWVNDHLKTVFHRRSMTIVAGTKNQKIERIRSNTNIVVINYESIQGMMDELVACKFDMIIFDESHLVKTHDSQRTIAATFLVRALHSVALETYGHICRVGLMTGTPTSQHIGDLRGQALVGNFGDHQGWKEISRRDEIITVEDFDWYGEAFLDTFCNVQGFSITDNPDMVLEAIKVMQPAFAPKTSEIIEAMPDQNVVELDCPMSESQQEAYDQMKANMFTEFMSAEGIPVQKLITNALTMAQVLLQLCSGFSYIPRNDGTMNTDAHYIASEQELDPKNAVVVDYLNTKAKSGVLIVAKHTAAVDRCYRKIKEHCPHVEVKKFDKKLTNNQKKDAIAWFNKVRTDGKIPVIISQYVRIAESVNLQEGGTTIFLSAVFKMAPAIQAMFRVPRISNTKPLVNLIFLYSSPLELKQYRTMMKKYHAMIETQSDMVDEGITQFHIPALTGPDADLSLRDAVQEELNR